MYTNAATAYEYLKDDFVTPLQVTRNCRGVFYTPDQIQRFSETVPSEDILRWCVANDGILVPGPHRPLSLLGVRDLRRGNFRWQHGGKAFQQSFADNEIVGPGWIMMRKHPMLDSTFLSKHEQLKNTPKDERLPTAVEAAWCLSVFKATRGVRLLQGHLTRVSNANVAVGFFSKDGICVTLMSDHIKDFRIGTANIRILH